MEGSKHAKKPVKVANIWRTSGWMVQGKGTSVDRKMAS